MNIYVDADACPVVVKEILFRAANRAKVSLTLVANQAMNVPNSPYIKAVQVTKGFDVADNEIVNRTQTGDLVITADIPLADEVITKGGVALSPRGDLYTKANIKSRLTMRNFMSELRDSGVQTGGQAAFNHSDRQTFANQLDKILAKLN